MNVKLRIALTGMDAIAGWAGKPPRWYDYLAAVIMLSPAIYDVLHL